MPTTDAIEYDRKKMAEMTQAGLLQQVCYRLDRHFPKREGELTASAFAQSIAKAVDEMIDNLPEPLATFKAQLREQLGTFKAVIG